MRLQDFLVRSTQKAAEDFFRAFAALPSDKLDWSPGGKARSALEQMREIAYSGKVMSKVIRESSFESFGSKEHREMWSKDWSGAGLELTKANDCLEAARRSTAELCAAIVESADEATEVEFETPWGATATFADILAMHQWNLIYHLGQVNEIALILGDEDMH